MDEKGEQNVSLEVREDSVFQGKMTRAQGGDLRRLGR